MNLVELEQVIEAGQQTFVDVGLALLTIRERRLYQQPTFREYLGERWPQLSVSHVYHLMDATTVVNNLEARGILPPTVSTQAVKLSILEPNDQATVWQEIREQKPTAQQVKVAAYHQYLARNHTGLFNLVQSGLMGAEPAYNLCRRLAKLHPDLVEALERAGLQKVTLDGIEALLVLARRNQEEYDDLLSSGFLQDGSREIPLAEITLRDVERYLARLRWEQVEPTALVVSDEPYQITQPTILFAFPSQVEKAIQTIRDQGGQVWMVAATFQGATLTVFGNPVNPLRMNMIPQPILDMIAKVSG